MSTPTVVRLPNRHRAREEASLWLARLDRGLSETESRELGEWLHEDPGHTEAFLQLAALWDQTAVLSELAELFPLERSSRRRRPVRTWWMSAAAVAAALVVAALVLVDLPLREDAPQAVAQTYETAVGGQSTVDLPDGSVVTLNTDSAIEVQYTDAERTVLLARGEVYFTVEPDRERPFRVHVGAKVFEAVGTAFNVRIGFDDDIEMMVTEGKVGVMARTASTAGNRGASSAEAEAMVAAGNLAVVGRSGVSIQALDAAQIEAELSWQQGMLMFEGEPLDSVLREMARYAPVDFVVDLSVRDVRVGGYFRAGDVDGLLVALRENFDIESARAADGRVIISASR